MTELEKLILKASFKKDIFEVLSKYNISFESKVAKDFEEIIEKINFEVDQGK